MFLYVPATLRCFALRVCLHMYLANFFVNPSATLATCISVDIIAAAFTQSLCISSCTGLFDLRLHNAMVREVFVGLIAPSFRSCIDRAQLLANLAVINLSHICCNHLLQRIHLLSHNKLQRIWLTLGRVSVCDNCAYEDPWIKKRHSISDLDISPMSTEYAPARHSELTGSLQRHRIRSSARLFAIHVNS
jgi:hypothetical protein